MKKDGKKWILLFITVSYAIILSTNLAAQSIVIPSVGEFGGPAPADDGVVGNLKGSFAHTPAGAMVYNVPLNLPPGTNGLTPVIGITYSSQTGNGLLGVGFSLSGLSSISRTGSNLYNDGTIKTLKFLYEDHFAIDGNRLVCDYGIYGYDGSVYHTETESFSKIIAHGQSGKGPAWFEVYSKDGMIYEYGKTADSRIEGQGISEVLIWNINRMRDRKGNYIDFVYSEINKTGEVYLTHVLYTGNLDTGSPPYYRIDIIYEDRKDETDLYVAGCKFNIRKRIAKVQIRYADNISDEQLIYEYLMEYNESNVAPFFSFLTSITLKGKTNYHLNPLEFTWSGEGSLSFSPTNNFEYFHINDNYLDNNDYPRHLADANGDGLADIIGFGDDGVYVSLSNGNGFDNPTKWNDGFGHNDGWYIKDQYSCGSGNNTFKARYGRVLADVNGDGMIDIVGFGNDGTFVRTSNGSSFQYYASIKDFHFASGDYPNMDDYPRFVADVNGDGMDDIIAYSWSGVRVAISSGSGFQKAIYWIKELGSGQNCPGTNEHWDVYEKCKKKYLRTIADVNGDGMMDLVGYGYDNTHIRISNGNGKFLYYDDLNKFCTSLGWSTDTYPRLIADVNGDGLGDIIGFSDSQVEVSLSSGKGFLSPKKWTNDFGALNGYSDEDNNEIDLYSREMADINGDGMADIVCFHDNGVEVALSTGHGFSNKIQWTNEYGTSNAWNNVIERPRLIGDFSGDGIPDIVGFYSDKTYFSISNRKQSKLIKTTDSYNNTEEYSYLPITSEVQGFYTHYSGLSLPYPVIHLRLPLTVLHTYSNNYNDIEYAYYDLKYHREGKGLLGFGSILTTVSNGNLTKETMMVFDLDKKYYHPYIKKEVTRLNQVVVNEKHYSPLFIDKGNKSFIFYYPEIFSLNYDVNGNGIKAGKTIKNLDNVGNIIFEGMYMDDDVNHQKGDPVSSYIYHKTVTNTFAAPDLNKWIFHLLETEIQNKSPDDQQGKSSLSSYEYYPQGHADYPLLQIKTIIPENNTSLAVKELYEYDDYGNLTKKTISAPYYSLQVTSKEIDYHYDPVYFGRFLTMKEQLVNTVNFEYEYEYDPVYGTLIKETGPDKLETNYEYDEFARLRRTTYADGNETAQVYRWIMLDPYHPDAHPFSIFYSWGKSSGESERLEFYDFYARKARVVNNITNTKKTYTDRNYDANGRLLFESYPHFSDQQEFAYKQYTYDNYGRIMKSQLIDGSTNTEINSVHFDYDGLISTVTNQPSGHWKKVTKNIAGHSESITDLSGTITYTYNASGKPISLNAIGIITNIEYDDYGRTSKLIDPDAGINQYTYNPFGKLIYSKDAQGNEFNMVYDAMGRMLSKSDISQNQVIQYTYDASQVGTGKISNISGGDLGYEKFYIYDNLGRLQKEKEKISNIMYEKKLIYDTYSRLASVDLPSGSSVQYHYNTHGIMDEMSDGSNNMLWQMMSINALGEIDMALLGNGLQTEKTFSIDGYLTRIETGNIQNLEYAYDAGTGNLVLRKDNTYNLTEIFTYDNMNRLTGYSSPASVSNLTYANNGNILSKSDVGNYQYNPQLAGPHAVTGINNPVQLPVETNQSVEYNSENNLKEINHLIEDKSYILYYSGLSQRIMSEYKKNGKILEKKHYILGSHEIVEDQQGNVLQRDYVTTPDGITIIFQNKNLQGNVTYYILKDHLRSYHAVTDNNGNIVQWNGQTQLYSFDAWGRRRNPYNWSYQNNPQEFMFDRGYTGHEHLDAFGLINMNGRTYDPLTARFLMPDNYIQDAEFSQSFNRYSYAGNNPLSNIDPDGEFVVSSMIAGALSFAYLGGVTTNSFQFNPAKWQWNSSATWAGIGIGMVAGALGGMAFATAGPALAGTAFFSHFSGAGIATAFSIAGTASFGAAGYLTGFGSAMAAGYGTSVANSAGLFWGAAGATAGSIGGMIYGLTGHAKQFLANPPLPPVDYERSYASISFPQTPIAINAKRSEIKPIGTNIIELERFEDGEKGTLGELSLNDVSFLYTLEPPGPSSSTEGSGLRIQAGIYSLKDYSSPRYSDVYELQNVPGRSKILMHIGNYPRNTTGCILPGLSYGLTPAVWNSGNAFDILRNHINTHGGVRNAIVLIIDGF